MDYENYENQVFSELPEVIECSNFTNCIFKASTHFVKCNLIACEFEEECTFEKSNNWEYHIIQ